MRWYRIWPCASSRDDRFRRRMTSLDAGAIRRESFSRGTRDKARVYLSFLIPSIYIFPQIGNTSNILYREAAHFIYFAERDSRHSGRADRFRMFDLSLISECKSISRAYVTRLSAIIINSDLFFGSQHASFHRNTRKKNVFRVTKKRTSTSLLLVT